MSPYTPMGQVEQWGLFADGLRRDPASRSVRRRRVAALGMWLVLVPLVVLALLSLFLR
jgi:hypothetical protein